MKSPQSERRGKARVTAGLAAQFSNEVGEEAVAAETMNLSMSGVCCRLPHPVEPLTKVKITLLVPEVKTKKKAKTAVVCTDGVVVRCEALDSEKDVSGYEIACAFLSLRDKDRKILQAYVDSRLAGEGATGGTMGSQAADL